MYNEVYIPKTLIMYLSKYLVRWFIVVYTVQEKCMAIYIYVDTFYICNFKEIWLKGK